MRGEKVRPGPTLSDEKRLKQTHPSIRGVSATWFGFLIAGLALAFLAPLVDAIWFYGLALFVGILLLAYLRVDDRRGSLLLPIFVGALTLYVLAGPLPSSWRVAIPLGGNISATLYPWKFGVIQLIIGLTILFFVRVYYNRTTYSVTNRRLTITKQRWFSKDVREVPLNQIQEVFLHQNGLERMLGVGNLEVRSELDPAGVLWLWDAPRPDELENLLYAK